MLRRPSLPILIGCLLLISSWAGAAQYRAGSPGLDPSSRVGIEVFSFYEQIPRHGFAPVRVIVENQTGRERTWTVAFSSNGSWDSQDLVSYEAGLTVPAGETKRFDLIVPLAQTANSSQLVAAFYGHGVRRAENAVHFASGGYGALAMTNAVTMSGSLSSRNWGSISDSIGGGADMNGSPFDLSLTPVSWRGFAGFDQVWMTDGDWLKIGGAERTALLDWIALGGTLYICREEGGKEALPHLAGLGPDSPLPHGFGVIRHWPREGEALDVSATSSEISNRPQLLSKQHNLQESYRSVGWQPLADLPPVQMRSGLVLVFLVLFALLIGPANLYIFARGARRYRLFWTTPALSIGASVLIFGLILLQDGVGGQGRQLALWVHFPAENKAAFIQEQVSRTALLTHRAFRTEHPVAVSPINTRSIGSISAGQMQAGRRTFGGDYFRNRSVQSQLIEGVAATRWRLEAAPTPDGDAPVVVSTFPFPLKSLYYIDEANHHWHVGELQPGLAQPMAPVSPLDFQNELNSFSDAAGPLIANKIPGASLRRAGNFYAFTENAPGATEKTLDSIRWQSRSLHIGTMHLSQP